MYDYLIVGAGLSGAIFAYEANKRGKKVKVIDKREHIGGNIYCLSYCQLSRTSLQSAFQYEHFLCFVGDKDTPRSQGQERRTL